MSNNHLQVVTICGTAKTSPGTMAVRLLQREVISVMGGDPRGFKLAKKLATLYYRSPADINGKCDWYPRNPNAPAIEADSSAIADSDGVSSTSVGRGPAKVSMKRIMDFHLGRIAFFSFTSSYITRPEGKKLAAP